MALFILLVLIMCNGLFAMTEFAVISARPARLRELAEQGHSSARKALQLAEAPERFLSAIQVGITLISILAGAYGSSTIAQDLSTQFQIDPTVTVGIVVGATTYLSLVIGELVPKQIALRNAETIALWLARPISLFSLLVAPVVWLLSLSTRLILRLLGISDVSRTPVTESEILHLVKEGVDIGAFDINEPQLVEAVFRLDELRVRSIITPRPTLNALDINGDEAEIKQTIIDDPHSVYPVYEDTTDNIIGIVQSFDLLVQQLEKRRLSFQELLLSPPFIPENASVSDLLHAIQNSEIDTTIIIDEYGGVLGIITLHDLLEAIIGEMDVDQPEAIQRADGSWLLDGLLPLHELQEVLPDITIPEDEIGNYQSLAGFVLTRFGRIPKATDTFMWNNYRFEVLDMDNKRIDKVSVNLLSESSDDVSHTTE